MSTVSQKKCRTQSGTAQETCLVVQVCCCLGLFIADLSQVTWMIFFSRAQRLVQEVHRILNDRGPSEGDVHGVLHCQIGDSPSELR